MIGRLQMWRPALAGPGVVSIAVMACALGGCGSRQTESSAVSRTSRPDAPRDELQPVVLPDLSRLAEPVRRQLQDQYASFAGKLASPATPQTEMADAYGDLGRLLLAARLGSPAETCFRHAERLAPGDRRWPYYLGHVSLLMGDRPKALAAFERAAARAPTDVATLVWLAETLLDEGRAAEAESRFLKAASVQPRSAAAFFGAGRAALARQAYADAVKHFEQALAIDPQASAVHYPTAMAYRALGDQQKAETHLAARGETWPALPDPLMEPQAGLLESVTVYERRGVEALAVRDWAAAAEAFRKGLELEPGDPALRHRLGTALYAAGDVAGAVREFEEVVRRSPGFAKASASLGTILGVRGQYPEAIARFSAALKSDPNSVEARLGLADALRVSGQPEASLSHYQRVIQLDPAAVDAWLGRAAALLTLKRNREAREWLAEARRVHPNEPKLAELAALVPAT